VSFGGLTACANLDGSSKYSSENFEGRSGEELQLVTASNKHLCLEGL